MRRNKNNVWFMNVIWLAGLVVIIFGRDYLDKNVLWRLTGSDDVMLYTWIRFGLSFFTGLYLSLLFVWNNFKVKGSALLYVVALPTLILAVLSPLLATVTIASLPEPVYWFINVINKGNYLPLIAGLTLIPSRTS